MPEDKKPTTILVVEEQEGRSSYIVPMLEEAGYRVLSTDCRDRALEITKTEKLQVMLVDLAFPGAQGLDLCRAIKSNPETRDIVVVLVGAEGNGKEADFQSPGSLLNGVHLVHRPLEQNHLLLRVKAELRFKAHLEELRRCYQNLSEKIEQAVATEENWIDKGCVNVESKILTFESDISRVPGIVNQLLVGIGAKLNRKTSNDLALGLHEMILNAIEHGNWGINSDEKSRALEANQFNELLENRQQDPIYAGKKVTIQYRFDGRRVIYRIRDEGEGFNWRSFMKRQQTEDPFAANGRGILISRYVFDSIVYNEKGNEVTLEKKIHGKSRNLQIG